MNSDNSNDQPDIFNHLFEVLQKRKEASPDTSYTASLFHKGTEKINSKILEEAQEVCEAALENDKTHLIYEICDLIFHSFVLASHKDISLSDLKSELQRREGTSGLEEKSSRPKSH